MRGVYVLIVLIGGDIRINVGALGNIFFEEGLYAYVGSAQNDVRKRVNRHLGDVKRKFWHIDYLLDNIAVRVVKVFCKEADKVEECRIAGKLGEKGIPVKNFGCSDCSCMSHLFKVKDYDFLKGFMSEMRF